MIKSHSAEKPALRLLLVRHGQTDWNADGRWQGQLDVQLNAMGRAQAVAVGQALANEPLDAIYASDLSRAWDTAQAIAAHHALTAHSDPRLREIALGDWQGLTYDQIEARDPDLAQRWIADATSMSSPNGEGQADLIARVQNCLHEMLERHAGQTVLWAAHGGVVRTMLCLALRTPPREHWRYRVGSTAITELIFYSGGPILMRANDQHHLRGLGLDL